MAKYRRHADRLQPKSRTHEVHLVSGRGRFEVISGTSGKAYTVFALADGRFECTCKWAEYHSAGECSHTIAVRQWLANAENRNLYAHDCEESARKAHQRIDDANDGLIFTSRKARA